MRSRWLVRHAHGFRQYVRDGKTTLRLWVQTAVVTLYLVTIAWGADWEITGTQIRVLGRICAVLALVTGILALMYLTLYRAQFNRLLHPLAWVVLTVPCVLIFYRAMAMTPNGVGILVFAGMAGMVAPFAGLGLSTMLDHSDERDKARGERPDGTGGRLEPPA